MGEHLGSRYVNGQACPRLNALSVAQKPNTSSRVVQLNYVKSTLIKSLENTLVAQKKKNLPQSWTLWN